MASDEENCIRAIAAALDQVAARLQGESLGAQQAQITTEEAAEFIEMLDAIVSNATSEDRARMLVFDVNPDLLPTLIGMLQTPHVAVPQGGLSRMLISCLRALARLATYHSKAAVSPSQPAALSYLATLTCTAIVGSGGVSGLTGLLGAAHTAEVHFAAGELLFSLLVRSEAARRALIETDGIAALLISLGQATSSHSRCFITACLREIANAHAVAVLQVPGALETVIRSLGLDDSPDVRALCAEVVDVVFKNEPYAWRGFEGTRELSAALTARLEKETSSDCLESCLKLLETLFVCDAAMMSSAPVHDRPDSTFTEFFLASFGDRFIVNTMAVSKRVSSLAARSLRLLLQLAPYYRYVGFNLCQHFPSLSVILRALVEIDIAASEKAEVTVQILRVELSIALTLMLAQDPRTRALVRQQLSNTPQWMAQLRVAVLGSLNTAALEYFTGVGITDVTGTLLNDPKSVKWEPNGNKPLRVSVEQVFDMQEQRWASDNNLPSNPTHISEVDPALAARLAFVLLGYVAHVTLTDVPMPKPAPAFGTEARHDAAPLPAGTSPLSPHLASSRGVPKQRIGNLEVGTTRSAMLREWIAHPVKSAAARRSEAEGLEPLPRPSAFFDTRDPAAMERGAASPRRTDHSNVAMVDPAFSKFDNALKLCTRFAQFFNNVGEPQRVVYETDGNFARRQPKNASWYAAPTPTAKSWSIEQLKEGDLFYFSLPFVSLSAASLTQIRQRATRHLRFIKNSFVITPQSARARRWFLFDMLNTVMPAVIDVLSLFIDLCVAHGDENVKFPVVMFRERDIAVDGGTLHSGNLVEIFEQVRFYFKSVAAKEPLPGAIPTRVAAGTNAERLTSQFLRDVEDKIKALSSAQFSGKETTFLSFDDDVSDDDDADFVMDAEPQGAHLMTRSRQARQALGYDSD